MLLVVLTGLAGFSGISSLSTFSTFSTLFAFDLDRLLEFAKGAAGEDGSAAENGVDIGAGREEER